MFLLSRGGGGHWHGGSIGMGGGWYDCSLRLPCGQVDSPLGQRALFKMVPCLLFSLMARGDGVLGGYVDAFSVIPSCYSLQYWELFKQELCPSRL